MPIFLTLVLKLLPLYVIIAAGYVLGRKQDGLGHTASLIQINLIAPVVMATSIATLAMRQDYLILPVIFLMICCSFAGIAYGFSKRFWSDGTGNLLAFMAGSANTGYFGIPVALILFPPDVIGLYMLAALGFQIYENTLGYYLVARGQYSVRTSLKRLARLPILYGCLVGIVLSALHVQLPEIITGVGRDFRGAYVVLGALMIGLGLSKLESFKIDYKFVSILLSVKFLLWPSCVMLLIMADRHVFGLFSVQIYQLLFLLAVVPLPANGVAFALLLNVHPEKAATTVFISTMIALFYIPAAFILLGFAH